MYSYSYCTLTILQIKNISNKFKMNVIMIKQKKFTTQGQTWLNEKKLKNLTL